MGDLKGYLLYKDNMNMLSFTNGGYLNVIPSTETTWYDTAQIPAEDWPES